MATLRAVLLASSLGLALVAVIGLWAGDAAADRGYIDVTPSPERNGLFIGASFGRGSIDVNCSACGDRPPIKEALSVAAHVGFMLTPRFGLLAEHWSVRYNARGGAWFDDSAEHLVAQHTSAIAAQVFLTNWLWLKAGIGMGWHITDEDYAREPSRSAAVPLVSRVNSSSSSSEEPTRAASPASFAAVGWELAHNTIFAAELQFRVGASRRSDDLYEVYSTGLNVGFSFY